ncbi:UNVERIFIED_CONTAM: hypothetical protein GTU68_017275 [Idotea baltica]|nr:hypothetical protein [Idotea baltica]
MAQSAHLPDRIGIRRPMASTNASAVTHPCSAQKPNMIQAPAGPVFTRRLMRTRSTNLRIASFFTHVRKRDAPPATPIWVMCFPTGLSRLVCVIA